MPIGMLTGYVLTMQPPLAEHTYVTSSHGHIWPCWGRSSKGRQICTGSGNTAQADCLSQPNSHAGIVYGVTGVCHQTANRILYPAGLTVAAAVGYRASVFAWGTYGRDLGARRLYSPVSLPWPELQHCQAQHVHP